MAKLSMKRIEIVALLSDRKKLVERLQRRGIVELVDFQSEELVKMNTTATISQLEKSINIATSAKSVLNEYAPAKKSLASSLNGRRELIVDDFGGYVKQSHEFLKYCYDLVSFQKTIIDDLATISRVQTLMDSLKMWVSLDVPMQYRGTKNSRCFIGIIPKQHTSDEILAQINVVNPELEMLEVEVISSFKEQTCIKVICHNDIATATNEALREIGFVLPSDPTKHNPSVRMGRFEKEVARCKAEIDVCTKKIKDLADKNDDIEFVIDYFSMRKEKYVALSKIGATKNTFIITGFIPQKFAKKCVDELEGRFSVAINISDPESDDDVPILLENGGFASPVEPITEMYALPNKRDVDPSPIMAFFYYLFFGMMLSDAGYGIIMVIGSAFILKKFSVEGSMRKTFKMFLYCGISTVFWGAMFGSWFGDIVQIVSKQFFGKTAPSLALWFEPLSDPMKLLLFSFALGIVHLFVGLAVNFKILWSEGKKLDAIFDVIPLYLMVLGAAPLAAGVLTTVPAIFNQVGKYMALTGVILIVLTSSRSSKNILARFGGGLYALYNAASGYLSDVLSYSRLLALGLATGSIAGVVNLMGSMPTNLIAKGIMLTVAFVVGHTLNMGINLLGAYVHTNRLQFVELFSKFYEGGGKAFNPLKVNTKYIKFKENVNNG